MNIKDNIKQSVRSSFSKNMCISFFEQKPHKDKEGFIEGILTASFHSKEYVFEKKIAYLYKEDDGLSDEERENICWKNLSNFLYKAGFSYLINQVKEEQENNK